ncbi:hypothetical protein [Ottowia beijingensis]|jgi:hypothetical protein|uniref:hypothetical protein n=1 Tax=Ottowia beijingensis TaxID=1207057 RepID=UPI002FDAE9AB
MPARHNELPLNEKSLNAVIDAMSAVTLCLTQILTHEQRERFGRDLVTMADIAGRKGKLELTSILLDLRAAVKAREEEIEAAETEAARLS